MVLEHVHQAARDSALNESSPKGENEALSTLLAAAERSSRLTLNELTIVEEHGITYVGVKTSNGTVPLSVFATNFMAGRFAVAALAEEFVAAKFDINPDSVHQKRYAKRERGKKRPSTAPESNPATNA
jgi:hypothetical protein